MEIGIHTFKLPTIEIDFSVVYDTTMNWAHFYAVHMLAARHSYIMYKSGWTLYIFMPRKKHSIHDYLPPSHFGSETHNSTAHRAPRWSVRRHKLSERAWGVERVRRKKWKIDKKFAFFAWSKTTPTTSSESNNEQKWTL